MDVEIDFALSVLGNSDIPNASNVVDGSISDAATTTESRNDNGFGVSTGFAGDRGSLGETSSMWSMFALG